MLILVRENFFSDFQFGFILLSNLVVGNNQGQRFVLKLLVYQIFISFFFFFFFWGGGGGGGRIPVVSQLNVNEWECELKGLVSL